MERGGVGDKPRVSEFLLKKKISKSIQKQPFKNFSYGHQVLCRYTGHGGLVTKSCPALLTPWTV